MLNLYNTLTKKLEEVPLKEHLNLYSCGPTVYNYPHIGNLRAYIVVDLLYRTLKSQGYNPKWVMNITDIDDKTIKGTIEKFGKDAGVSELKKFTEEFFQAFLKDLDEVNVLKREVTFIKVTDVIPQIQEFIVALLEKDFAYKAEDGSTYFSIEKYQQSIGDYGELVGAKFLDGKKIGARVKVDEYEKDNLSDFALWKAHDAADANIFWDHKVLGKGRPGWHIECSVINQVAFGGEPTDIHTGGVDLIFPHHTNEIAQSQALLGRGNFVRHWLHSEHLLVDGKKMAKSAKNFYTLEDIMNKGFSGKDLRYLMLSSVYNKQQNFTFEELLAAKKARLRYLTKETASSKLPESFELAVNNNLNYPMAVGIAIKAAGLNFTGALTGLEADVQDLKTPQEVGQLLEHREQAKQKKDFAKSDEIRKQIESLGYEVMDTSEGQKVKKKI